MVIYWSTWNRRDSGLSTDSSPSESTEETEKFRVQLEPRQYIDISKKTVRTYIYNKSISGLRANITLDKFGRLFVTLKRADGE